MAGTDTDSRGRRVRDDAAAVALGIVGAAIVRRGAFETGDALVIPVLLSILCVVARCRVERAWRWPLGWLSALAAWWMVAAVGWGDVTDALPLFGSFVGFGAGAVLASNLDTDQRRQVGSWLTVGAALFAAAGLVGVALRADALASQAQGLWRLSGTLTYANAAGLLLAMVLPIALSRSGGEPDARWPAVVTALVTAGLVATMSRGAALALLVALPLYAHHLRNSWWPALAGAAIGMVSIATASAEGAQPVLLIACAGGVAAAWIGRPPARVGVAAGVVVVGLVAAVPALRTGFAEAADRRLSLSEIDDRTPEWKGAWREFVDDPIVGNGPERPFVSRPRARTEIARYAHSEPLQIASSAGLVGFSLLSGVAVALYLLLRTRGAVKEAAAGLTVLAVGGLLDFSWHVPAIGMVGGVLTALSTRLERKEGEREGRR